MGRFAEETGCDRERIRFYERIGLIAEPDRSSAGYRLYHPTDAKRVRFILRCRHLGFSIDQIRGLLTLVDEQSYTCSGVQSFTQNHLEQVRDKLRDLRSLEQALEKMVVRCHGEETPDCRIIDTLFQ